MKTKNPSENNFEIIKPQVEGEKEVQYTFVIFSSFFGPDSDPPSHSYHWQAEPFVDYGDVCVEAKMKAFEHVVPGCTLVTYREGEKQTGHLNEYEVLYEISDEEHCIRICLTTEYGDAEFREWEE